MNELIARLYDQAIVLEGNGDYVAGELDPVKFAEKIIEECIYAVYCSGGDNESYHIRAIKQHFGVE